MGRELMRVPLDFSWPLKQPWEGYINRRGEGHSTNCPTCCGTGRSAIAQHFHQLWYGQIPFRPEDRGSTPFLPTHANIWARAEWNVNQSPDYYGVPTNPVHLFQKLYVSIEEVKHGIIKVEATRLAGHFNCRWCHHLNDGDVAALLKHHGLHDLTHDFIPGKGWTPKDPPVIPTALQVNEWSLKSMGHDSLNSYACVKGECDRLNERFDCATCAGEGSLWSSPEAKEWTEKWEPTEPPTGDGYQMWETVSEGSPISPVFRTSLELAEWLAANRKNTVDEGTTVEQWMAFIEGPGWAPSGIKTDASGVQSGVIGMVGQAS